MPEIPHNKTNGRHQNPRALWTSQLILGKCARQLTVRLRLQCLIPGHHINAPVRPNSVTEIPPTSIHDSANIPYQKLAVKSYEPLERERTRKFVTENDGSSGNAHQQHIWGGHRPHPEVNLEDDLPDARLLGVLQPLLPMVQLSSSAVCISAVR